MPLYEFYCKRCNKVFDVQRDISSCGQPYTCDSCKLPAERVYSTFAHKEWQDYSSKNMGNKRIGGPAQEARMMKRYGRVETRDLPWFKDFKSHEKRARRKPIYSTRTGKKTSKAHD